MRSKIVLVLVLVLENQRDGVNWQFDLHRQQRYLKELLDIIPSTRTITNKDNLSQFIRRMNHMLCGAAKSLDLKGLIIENYWFMVFFSFF
jgi:hypothetical protein